MPRPAAKRNRLATRTLGVSDHTQGHGPRSTVESRGISRSPTSDSVGNSRLADSADPSDIIRQLRNQTPISKAHEFAIGSSPGTEQGVTGSRPPTRARGYSSTLSIAGRKGDNGSRVQGTPAFESSILSNFRRRPRQASILHMMQDEDGSSDLDDDDFLGGLSPQDESTPLNISRGKSLVLGPAISSLDKSPSLPSIGNSSKRKRSTDRPEPQSPLYLASIMPGTPRPKLATLRSEASVESHGLAETPAAFSETMVPPMSSPVFNSTLETSTQEADRLPPGTRRARNAKPAPAKDKKLQLPTAALQNKLLPQRRRRRPRRQNLSKFDVLSDSEDDLPSAAADDDELSFLPMQKRSPAPRPPTSTKPLRTNRANLNSNTHDKDGKEFKRYEASSHEEKNYLKENKPMEVSSPLSSALDTDELDSEFDLGQEAPAKAFLSEELRLQALKFAEIDKWQMEFEDVVTVGTQENGAFRRYEAINGQFAIVKPKRRTFESLQHLITKILPVNSSPHCANVQISRNIPAAGTPLLLIPHPVGCSNIGPMQAALHRTEIKAPHRPTRALSNLFTARNRIAMTSLDSILADKYPAKAHARRVAEGLKALGHSGGAIYLEAQKTRLIEDNDEPVPFRQRRPFFYLSGCLLPDSSLVYNIDSDQLTLFIPPINPDDVIWSGLPLSAAEALERYDVDNVLETTEVNATLANIAASHANNSTAFAIAEQVSEGTKFEGFSETNFNVLKGVIERTRVVKDSYEIALLRKANDISAKGHIAAIKASKSATNEREIEAAFIATCIANGAREQSYHPIVACGQNGATLHYGKNDEDLIDPVTNRRKDNVLIDAGAEYRTYCADITRAFPLNGKFLPETRQIYEIVLRMQLECIDMLKEGVQWEDVHAHAHRVAIRGLLELGILRGSEDELFDKRISVAFFPHGLGHYLGMDTHDTGGNPNYEDTDTMFRYLRVRGRLPAGSVITVEPGIYFCRFIIEPFLKNPDLQKYIDVGTLNRYWRVGGVRIEDNVHITKDGHDNLTTAPKTIEEVESLAA